MAVSGRPIDRNAGFLEPLARRVNIIDLVGQVSKVAAPRIGLRIPVVGEFNLSLGVARCPEKNQGKTAGLHVDTPLLDQPEVLAIELEGSFQVRNANHRV